MKDEFLKGLLFRLNNATKPVDAADRNLIVRALSNSTQGADARPVAWATKLPSGNLSSVRPSLKGAEKRTAAWNERFPNPPHAVTVALCECATRDAAPSDAQLHIAADEVIRIANAYFGIYPQDDPMRVDFKTAVFNASREFSKDARRYQALRDRDLDALKTGGVFAGMIPENVVLNGADLDAAADKLLSAIAPMEKT